MSHHTKDSGDLGVLKAQSDLCQQGYMVCLPLSETSPFDLVVYKNGMFKRIQVKFRSLNSRGTLDVKFDSIWSDTHGVHRKRIDKREIDLFCIYCPDTDECYYFDPLKFRRSVTLRVRTSANSQKKGINPVSEYRRVP